MPYSRPADGGQQQTPLDVPVTATSHGRLGRRRTLSHYIGYPAES
jgi:hypothetical protein